MSCSGTQTFNYLQKSNKTRGEAILIASKHLIMSISNARSAESTAFEETKEYAFNRIMGHPTHRDKTASSTMHLCEKRSTVSTAMIGHKIMGSLPTSLYHPSSNWTRASPSKPQRPPQQPLGTSKNNDQTTRDQNDASHEDLLYILLLQVQWGFL